MNLGAENRNKVIAAVSLVVIAVVLMATRFSGFMGSSPSSASIPPPAQLGDHASSGQRPVPAPRETPTEAPVQDKARRSRSIQLFALIF